MTIRLRHLILYKSNESTKFYITNIYLSRVKSRSKKNIYMLLINFCNLYIYFTQFFQKNIPEWCEINVFPTSSCQHWGKKGCYTDGGRQFRATRYICNRPSLADAFAKRMHSRLCVLRILAATCLLVHLSPTQAKHSGHCLRDCLLIRHRGAGIPHF